MSNLGPLPIARGGSSSFSASAPAGAVNVISTAVNVRGVILRTLTGQGTGNFSATTTSVNGAANGVQIVNVNNTSFIYPRDLLLPPGLGLDIGGAAAGAGFVVGSYDIL